MLVRQERGGPSTGEPETLQKDAPAPAAAAAPAGRRRAHRPALIGLLLFLVAMTAAWAIATPFGGYPDEIDHYLRASAVTHGQFLGEHNPYLDNTAPPTQKACCGGANPAAEYWVQAGLRRVVVPADLQPERIGCDDVVITTRFDCAAPPRPGDDRYDTLMGTIEPVSYAASGSALVLAGGSSNAFRFGRMGLALVGILAIGLVLAGCVGRPSFARRVVGLALATTPMVLFVLSSGSPNAAETAGALGVWLAMLELTADPAGRTLRSARLLWAGLALSGVLLASARSLGPLFVVAIVTVVLVARGAGPFLARVRRDRRPALVTLIAVGLAACGTVAWETIVQPHIAVDRQFAASQLDAAWLDVFRVMREVVGDFASLELPLPPFVVALWLGLGLVAVAAALVTARRRARAALGLLLVLSVVAMIAIDTLVMRQNGFPIQGRHVLALLVGIPLLATDVVRRPAWLARFAGRAPAERMAQIGVASRIVLASLGGLIGLVQLYAWTFAASSYTPTPRGRLLTEAFAGNWSVRHPKPLATLAVVAVLTLVASVGWALLPSTTPADADDLGA